jgi:hypothetical protein
VTTPAVQINSASAEAISELYDIGPILATRIVRYRDTFGYFRGPDDLSRVEGVSASLAVTLAPHIDWTSPKQVAEKRDRDWVMAIGALVIAFTIAWPLAKLWSVFPYGSPRFQSGAPSKWSLLLTMSSILVSGSCITLYLLLSAVYAITTSRRLAISLVRPRRYLVYLTTLGLVGAFVGYTVRYGLFSLRSWTHCSTDQPGLDLLVQVVLAATFGGIFAAVYLRPALVGNPWLIRTANIVALVLLLELAWWIRQYHSLFPTWYLLVIGLIGCSVMFLAVQALRHGGSLLEAVFELVPRSTRLDDQATWITWINSRLPDPNQQQALKQALTRQYPRSRAKTLISIVLFGAGGWLVLTVIAAIIQGFIQIKWLEPLLR